MDRRLRAFINFQAKINTIFQQLTVVSQLSAHHETRQTDLNSCSLTTSPRYSIINWPARRGSFVRMPQPFPSVRNRSRHWTQSCLWMRWLSHWSAQGQVLGEHSAKLILERQLEKQMAQRPTRGCADMCFIITHTEIPPFQGTRRCEVEHRALWRKPRKHLGFTDSGNHPGSFSQFDHQAFYSCMSSFHNPTEASRPHRHLWQSRPLAFTLIHTQKRRHQQTQNLTSLVFKT